MISRQPIQKIRFVKPFLWWRVLARAAIATGAVLLASALLFHSLAVRAQTPAQIVIYDPDGTALGTLSLDTQPDGLAIGPDGQLFVKINQNHRIVRYDRAGNKLGEFTTEGAPDALAVGPDGQVYVKINQNHRIVRYSPGGDILGAIEMVEDPDGFAVGPDGSVYVRINQNHRIVRYGPEGEVRGIWQTEGTPDALAVGPDGQVYVKINQNHHVVRYDQMGNKVGEFPTVFVLNSQAEEPQSNPATTAGTDGMAIGPKGEIYVTIDQDHRVTRFDDTGEIFALWNTVDPPNPFAVGPNGLVYITTSAGQLPTPPSCPQDAYEPNQSASQAWPISPTTTIQAYICPPLDEDWFTVTLDTGDILEANLTGLAADFDLILWPAGTNSTPVVLSRNRGTAPESFSYLARTAGTYYLQVVGYGGGSSTQPYQLQVQGTAGGKPGILQFYKDASVAWPNKVKVGDLVTYTLGIEHVGGTAPWANLVLTDVLPFEAVLVGQPTARVIAGTFTPLATTLDSNLPPHGAVRWQGRVAPDSRGEIEFTVRIIGCPRGTYDPEGNPVVRNTAELLRPDGLVATAGLDVWVDCTPSPLSGSFKFTKSTSVQAGTSVKVGDSFFYILDVEELTPLTTITNPNQIFNPAPAQFIGPIVLGDWLPAQVKLKYINGQPVVGYQSVVSTVLPFNTQVLPPRIVGWEALVTPASHGRFVYAVDVVACPPADANSDHIIHDTAKLQLPDGGIITATADVPVDCPAATLPKVTLSKTMHIPHLQTGPRGATVATDTVQLFTPDQKPVFEFSLNNQDTEDYAIVVTDTLPEGLLATDVTVDGGDARILDDGHTIVWNVDSAAGSTTGMIAYTKPSMKLICEQMFINEARWATQLPDGSNYVDLSSPVHARLVCRDLGDAPDSTNHAGLAMEAYPGVQASFPTVYDTATGTPPGPVHLLPLSDAWLGERVSGEQDADLLPDVDGLTNLEPITDTANRDRYDDGLSLPITLTHCEPTTVQVVVTVKGPQQDRYLNAWFDWNRDGDWEDTLDCSGKPAAEWAVRDYVTNLGPGTHVINLPTFLPFDQQPDEPLWARITLSDEPAPVNPSTGLADGRGPDNGYRFGETEDYLIGGTREPDLAVRQRASLKKVTHNIPDYDSWTLWETSWSIEYENVGNASATGAKLTSRTQGLPPGRVWSASPGFPSSFDGKDTTTMQIGTFKAGDKGSAVLTVGSIPITTTPGTVFTHTVTVSADKDVDSSNNTSVVTLTVPLSPPTIAYPVPGTTCSGELTVTGQAQVGTFVDLYVDGIYTATTTVDQNGAWEVPFTLPDGTHTVYAKARTVLGDESQPSPTVKFIVDSTLPWDPMSLRFITPWGSSVTPQGLKGRVDVGAWTLSLRKGYTYTAQVHVCCANPGAVSMDIPQVGSRNLSDPDSDGTYTVAFQTPMTGTIQGKLRICVVNKGVKQCSDGQVTIDPEGKVFDAVHGQLVDGASVACLQSQAGDTQPTFGLWPAADFGQANPQTTGADGYFSFFTPPGTYRLQVAKSGYQTYRSQNLPVVDQPVHFDVPLTPDVADSPVVTVTVDSSGFHPVAVEVQPGSVVAWVNMDASVHSSTSVTPTVSCSVCAASPGSADAWDSGLLEPGEVYKRQLGAAGTYTYQDTTNALNTGTIVVQQSRVFLPIIVR